MKYIAVYMTLVTLAIRTDGRQFSYGQWPRFIEPDDSLSLQDDCLTGPCDELYPEKRSRGVEDPEQMLPLASSYHSTSVSWPWMCPCETQYGLLDLGPGHYPRYLARAQCAPKACRTRLNQCKLINYKVHILREREPTDGAETSDEPYVEHSVLPEPLRVKWQLKPVKIAVACVALTDGKRN
ncbi:prothoracicotropic hormone-like [Diachasmimorpha longicaudata]|uniref:prothoracicotropic hormone-like n=1 Tax=Diachasmimorpha longicaudata TaxID=58733 RepID=UPI0030B89E94